MTDTGWNEFQKRRSESPFRMRFHLTDDEKQIVYEKGMANMRIKAEEIIRKRLSAAFPTNDGKQTPMKGYPVFKAQHATGCCCRGCLEKWHHIPKGRALEEAEIEYIADVIMRWIDDEMKGYSPQQPLLF